jgi:hypothetical protein
MEYLQQHRVAQRAQAAAADPNPDPKILEGIDQDIFSAMMAAEKKYGISFLLPWSPDLTEAKKRKKFWAMWLTEFRTRRNLSHQRSKISKIVPDLAVYLERPLFTLVRKKLKEAKKQLRNVIKSADEIRAKHLDERTAAYGLANDMTKEKGEGSQENPHSRTSKSHVPAHPTSAREGPQRRHKQNPGTR